MNKVSGGDGIPIELFQILKDDTVKVLHSICCEFGKFSSGHRTGKGQFSFQSLRKAILKNAKTTAQLHSSHMLKILQARLQQYMNWELLDVQAGFRKGRGTRDQIANICWIIKKAREFQKNIYFCFIDYAKAFVWIRTNSSLVAQSVKIFPAFWEMWVWSLGQGNPLRRKWLPTLVLLPREFHRQRALVGYSPWGHKELDMTEWLTLWTYCGKFFKRWEYQTTLLASWEIPVQIKKQQL